MLDQREAYHHIQIKEGDKWKTVFQTRYGLYEYLVMLFRLTNALALQQALLNSILYKYLDDFCMVYLNDIVIYIKETREDHVTKVKKVLKRLEDYDLLLKLLKCKFLKKKMIFLEHVITTEEIRIKNGKV